MPKIVYLEAQGTATFRSGLRSDTLWGILCWTIRMLKGENAVSTLIKGYDYVDIEGKQEKADNKEAFYLSSAFPWLEIDNKRTHFLPAPLVQPSESDNNRIYKANTARSKKILARKYKKAAGSRKGFISWDEFAYHFGNETTKPKNEDWGLKIETQAVTHNQIDRRRLGTFTENDAGQLFHMKENYLQWDKNLTVGKHGFYFLLEGNTSLVEPALRLLETMGIAGDKSIGKGHFKIEVKDTDNLPNSTAEFPKVDDNEADAYLNLSLYKPGRDINEVIAYEEAAKAQGDQYWQYKLEDRQGRNVYHNNLLQNGRLLFSEGSIFPKAGLSKHPGQNWESGKHPMGHKICRYGHAFMLNMKLK